MIIVNGFHPPQWTEQFLTHFPEVKNLQIWTQSPLHLTLTPTLQPVLIIAYSAGIIGALQWTKQTNIPIKALIAVDPFLLSLYCPFPVYTLSHDILTHHSFLTSSHQQFYAYPPTSHQALWCSPNQTRGKIPHGLGCTELSTALIFIRSILHQYGEM